MTQTIDEDYQIVATYAPLPWPKETKEIWKIEEEPQGNGRVWISDAGRILWHPPMEDDTVTFEERTLPKEMDGIEQLIRSKEMEGEMQWRRFYHGLSNMESDKEEEEMSERPSAHTVRAKKAHACSEYVINSYKGSQEELEHEAHYSQNCVDETEFEKKWNPETLEGEGAVNVNPSTIEKLPEGEKKIWIDAMSQELDSLCMREVYTEVNEESLPRNFRGKLTRLPSKMVTVKKPTHDGNGSWKAKARVVCCGNFEPNSVGKDLENRSEVPSTFEMRTMLALASSNNWSVGTLDVKTAFLYAELDDEEDGMIFVQPPAILVRIGLVKKGIFWKLKKGTVWTKMCPQKMEQSKRRKIE